MHGDVLLKPTENKRATTQSVTPRKLSVPQDPDDENAISHAHEGLTSKRKRDDSNAQESVLDKKPIVEIGPPRTANGALSTGAIKDALRDWKVERSGPSGYRASRAFSRDRLDDQGSRVIAKRGSAREVEGMFALAEAKNWDRMVFDGSDTFKERVMRTALEKGYDVKVNSNYDQKLFDKVRQKFETDRSNAMEGKSVRAELPKASPVEQKRPPLESRGANGTPVQTLLNGESNERSIPALPAPENVTRAQDILDEGQFNAEHDKDASPTGPTTKTLEKSDILKKAPIKLS